MTMTADRVTKPARRRKRRPGKPNVPAVELEHIEGVSFGEAMLALPSDKHRIFVQLLYSLPPGWGANAKAARLAGFGTSTSSDGAMASAGYRLSHDERILRAIAEEDRKRIRASAPRAIRALTALVENPDAKDHARGIAMVLDRTHAVQQHHVVDVHHHVDHDAEAVAQLRMLKALEVSRAKLEEVFGFSGLSRYERLLELDDAKKSPPMIEGHATEIKGNAA